ncbi:unnamed protein product [Cunninghamella blakesleeana]
MYKLIFFVPKTHKEVVKHALFGIGAGRFINYDSCCFEVEGHGQFRPLDGNNAFVGTTGQLERIEEYKVEMVCKEEIIKEAIKTLIDSHPYEEPAYEVYKMVDIHL